MRSDSIAGSQSPGSEAEASEQGGGLAGEELASGGDVASAPAVEEGEGEVVGDGEGLWGVGGAGGRGVLGEDDVAQPMEAIFDPPARPPEAEQRWGGRLLGGERGDGVGGLVGQEGAGATVEPPAPAGATASPAAQA